MAISFIRIDDRIIHGQVVTRWAQENECDGILAVNDEAAANELFRNALKSASTKKVLVYSLEDFKIKVEQAVLSSKKYFLITKNPQTLKEILKFYKIPLKVINVGPQSARENSIHVNNNADLIKEEIIDFEEIFNLGYEIDFRLVPDSKNVLYSNVRESLLKKI